MALAEHIALGLNPSDFQVVPRVAALDEFRMTDPDGTFVANITPEYLTKFVAHMNERESLTGDLSPIVIGHTKSGEREIDAPPLVGYARNWSLGELGATGRKCAFFDAWILKDKVQLAKQFPRRSCEVWASRYEADPISLLGATTPARDLGLMKLSRDGSFTYTSPGEMNMADEPKKPEESKTEKPAPDKKESGEAKKESGQWDQVLALLSSIAEKLGVGGSPTGAAAPAEPAPAGDAQMGDAEYEKLLQELMAGQGGDATAGEPRKPEKPEEAPVKNQREEETAQKLAELQSEVSRMRVKEALVKLQRDGKDVNPDDDALIADLSAMPDDMRARQLDRMRQFSRPTPGAPSFHLDAALAGAVTGGTKGKRIQNAEEQKNLIRLARDKNMDFGAYLRSEGYDVG